jgi:hypothetical protein
MDIVDLLRHWAVGDENPLRAAGCREAAAEIERLRNGLTADDIDCILDALGQYSPADDRCSHVADKIRGWAK